MSQINQLIESTLVRQILLLGEAQESLAATRKNFKEDECILEASKHISEISRGLNELSQAILSLKEAGICEVDRESIAVFLNKIEKGINNEPR